MLNQIDLSRADLNLLTLFEVVLRERHVGRAAARLNLSPSAVSHGLKRLRLLLNDPLFLGVVPTARAAQLAEPIGEVLARVRNVISSSGAFDPATSSRRFIIAAPDGISSVILHPLLAILKARAPGIDIGLRQLLPTQAGLSTERAWESALIDLESGATFSGHDVARGASGGNGVGIDDVWFDVRSPAGRLGNAVGGALSDCPFWRRASAFHPAA